jgi:hypothetical protein
LSQGTTVQDLILLSSLGEQRFARGGSWMCQDGDDANAPAPS